MIFVPLGTLGKAMEIALPTAVLVTTEELVETEIGILATGAFFAGIDSSLIEARVFN